MQISGLHHVTAICSDPQENVDFYCKVLGLRLVKVTINFDDPGTYHLYYGDEVGSPGSALTFFSWPNQVRGKAGTSQTNLIAFSVPVGSMDWWVNRVKEFKLATTAISPDSLTLEDPDGILLELTEQEDHRSPWLGAGIPPDKAIRGFDSVNLLVGKVDQTKTLLESMGFAQIGDREGLEIMRIHEGAPGQKIRLQPNRERGTAGVGTIHHIAFATKSDESQKACSDELTDLGFQPTPVQDRQYFRSIYYREPSGILYEIATEGPGFLTDEPVETLGSRLCIPPWYEKFRTQIEEALPKIVTPSGSTIPALEPV